MARLIPENLVPVYPRPSRLEKEEAGLLGVELAGEDSDVLASASR